MRIATTMIVILGLASGAQGQAPEKTIAEVARNRDQLKAVHVEMSLKIVQVAKMNVQTHKTEAITPITTSRKISVVVDFTAGRYRWSYIGDEYDSKTKSLVPYRASIAYDGAILRSVVYPRSGETDALPGTARRSDFAELSGDLQGQEFPPNERPLYLSFGVVPAGGLRPLFPGGFHKYDLRKQEDTFFPTVNPPVGVPGTWLTSVQTGPSAGDSSNRYCFDPKLGSALIHWQTLKKTVPYYSASLSYNLKGNRAILGGWTFDDYFNGVKMVSYSYNVTQIDYDYVPADSDFELKPEFGMVSSKIKYDRVDGQPSVVPAVDVFRVAENGELIPLDSRMGWGARNLSLILWAACSVIVVTAVWFFYRRFRKHPQQGN